jgi:hypothetical protein
MSQPSGPGSQDGAGPAVSSLLDLRDVAAAINVLSKDGDGGDDGPPLQRLVDVVVEQVPGACWASVTVMRNGQFATAASTGDAADRADMLQYQAGSGPCLEAILEDGFCLADDLSTEQRWPQWSPRVARDLGIRAVVAQRLNLQDHGEFTAAVNVYSDQVHGLDEQSVAMALILATHAAHVVGENLADERAHQLRRALESNREIGVAMGILMHAHHLTREQAFDVLRVASQNSNRKLADLAVDVVDTGTLDIPRRPPRG